MRRRTKAEMQSDIKEGTKVCSECLERKNFKEFHKNSRFLDGLQCSCKQCRNLNKAQWRLNNPELNTYIRRKHTYKKRFGISVEEYETLHEKQKGVCALCGKSEEDNKSFGKTGRLSVDHNHITGKVRGLLCNNCNSMLGLSNDSVRVLKRAVKYLEDNGSYGEDKGITNENYMEIYTGT